MRSISMKSWCFIILVTIVFALSISMLGYAYWNLRFVNNFSSQISLGSTIGQALDVTTSWQGENNLLVQCSSESTGYFTLVIRIIDQSNFNEYPLTFKWDGVSLVLNPDLDRAEDTPAYSLIRKNDRSLWLFIHDYEDHGIIDSHRYLIEFSSSHPE